MNRPYVVVVAYAVTAASAAAAEDISRQFAADDRFLFVTQPLAATHDAIENPEFEIEASHAGELLTPAAAASVPVPPGAPAVGRIVRHNGSGLHGRVDGYEWRHGTPHVNVTLCAPGRPEPMVWPAGHVAPTDDAP